MPAAPRQHAHRFLVGLIGAGLEPSLSPALHELEADHLGLRYLYQRIDLDELGLDADSVGALLDEARRMGFRGVNVTHPCKQAVLPHLDELAEPARILGAVNTVVFDPAGSVGHNTDWSGFEASFERGLSDVARDRVVLVGAGGAGAAVAHGALCQRVSILVVSDRDPERAKALHDDLVRDFAPERVRWCDATDLVREIAAADGVIHATPTGMAASPGIAFEAELLQPHQWVAEVVYRPLDTELLKAARARGCRTLDGGGMAVFQAAESLRIFTGRTPDVERMFRHFSQLADGELAEVFAEGQPAT
jgi:shikimate dehydrogenase